MGRYIDGFVLPVRKDRLDDYRSSAEQNATIWKEYGALDYWECVGDDLDVNGMVSFSRLVQANPDETVIFAWVVYESREHRDQANMRIMADPRFLERIRQDHARRGRAFDPKRMAYGGFQELVHANLDHDPTLSVGDLPRSEPEPE